MSAKTNGAGGETIELAGPSHRHLPALDGVRGLAILLVLVVHLLLVNNDTGSLWWDSLSQVPRLGFLGVDLFFVLSGFLITGILFDTLRESHYFRNFYMRRFLRIFPLYYGFLLFLVAIAWFWHTPWGGRQFVLFAYLQNTGIWFPVDAFHPGRLVDLNHFWSLAVEEQFYFVWPMLVFLVRDRRRLMQLAAVLSACALAIRIALSLHPTPYRMGLVHAWTLCRMDTLMIGGWLALALRGDRTPVSRRAAAIWFWTVGIVMIAYALGHPRMDLGNSIMIGTVGYSMCAIAFAALIYLSLDLESRWNRLFQMRWLRSFGKYSYGIYVLHIFVGYVFGVGVRNLLDTSIRLYLAPRLHSRLLAIVIEFLVTVAVVYAAAYVSYNVYEVRFLRLKRYFDYRRMKQDTKPQQSRG